MRLSDIKFDTDSEGNIKLLFPKLFAENELYLTNYSLPFLFMTIKKKVGEEYWNELKDQIKDM